MKFDQDLNKENNWNTVEQCPAFVDFYSYERTGIKTLFSTKKHILRINSTLRKLLDKRYLLDYLHARLVLQNLDKRITKTGIERIPEVIIKNEKLNKITTCKRMITQLTNKKIKYEDYQNKTLLPNWDNPRYIKLKNKLENYKSELKELTK